MSKIQHTENIPIENAIKIGNLETTVHKVNNKVEGLNTKVDELDEQIQKNQEFMTLSVDKILDKFNDYISKNLISTLFTVSCTFLTMLFIGYGAYVSSFNLDKEIVSNQVMTKKIVEATIQNMIDKKNYKRDIPKP